MKHRTVLPISAQTMTGFRTFAKVERKARIASRHEKLVEIAIKHENGTPLSRQEGLIEGIQELDAKTGLLIAD